MEPLNSELKSVTDATTFKAVRVFDEGSERHALIDQDGQLVGLVGREAPYFINDTFCKACETAKQGLRLGASYKGYSCSPFGDHHFVLDRTLEPVTEFSDIPEVRKMEELANDALALSNRLKQRRETDTRHLPNEKIIN